MDHVELHLHDYYSLLDGLNSPAEYFARAKEIGMTHLPQTNHGTLSGWREWQEQAKIAGIIPILGVEAYITHDRFDKRSKALRADGTSIYNHIVLLAQNQTGIDTILRLQEKAWTEGYYYKPRIDTQLLFGDNEGVIALSGCMGGVIPKALEAGDMDMALQVASAYKDTLGDRFFIEVQGHNPPILNEGLFYIADKLGIKPVATSDCHYARKEDLWVEQAMLILSSSPKRRSGIDFAKSQKMDILERYNYLYPDRQMSFEQIEIFLRDRQTNIELFAKQGVTRTDIYDNTVDIASTIGEYDYHTGLDLLPRPKNYDPDTLLWSKILKGIKDRKMEGRQDVLDRATDEFNIIAAKNLSTYILIVGNMVSWAREQDIPVGPGRGSGAGCLVNYLLGSTDVDPIKYGLLFFRFIDPARDDEPDIDVDFGHRRRGEVKDNLRRTFTNVASIATFPKFQGKNSIKDAARVFNIPIGDANRATKNNDAPPGSDYFITFDASEQGRVFTKQYPEAVSLAKRLYGKVRGGGMHPSGVVLANQPLSNYAPLETAKDPNDKNGPRISMVAMDMNQAADLGLIKLDVLGLKSMTVIDDTVKWVKKRHGIDINLLSLDLEDKNVYSMISEGYTKGIFQCSAMPYTSLILDMGGVWSFAELAASNALVRPGAMNTIGTEYIARKNGKSMTEYASPIMQPFTSETYGEVLYQEQVMLTMTELAGMSMSDANKVRKIIGKKKDPIEFEEYKAKFIEGASKNVKPAVAKKLWHDFEAHAGYSLNKCFFGDTIITRASSGRFNPSPDITIEDFYTAWNSKTAVGKKYRAASRGVKIMAMDSDGRVRPKKVKGVYQNGVQSGYRVTLSDGKSITTTDNHRHLTSDGYKMVKDIRVGDTMYATELTYEYTGYIKNGLDKGWVGNTSNRAIANDGHLRQSTPGVSSEYKRNVALLPEGCEECGSTAGRLEIAHVDSDRTNSSLGNLRRLCNSHHKKLDYAFGSRKRRHSKGYPVNQAIVVSIEYVGEEMTYDIEMDTEEHNLIANGIVTHNSHAIAYSMVSYWTAWLKYYYPLEFMASTLLSEDDKDVITDYLIESKRLGLKVLLPNINASEPGITIQDEGIRLGLTSVKGIGDNVAGKILLNRPFVSYAALKAKVEEKNSGLGVGILKSLNAIGGATFADNPKTGHERDNYYEYLKIPAFEVKGMEPRIRQKFRDLDEFSEKGAFPILGMVRKIARGPGWARVEIVDETGNAGIFAGDQIPLEPGQMYAILVADNRVAKYMTMKELDEGLNNSFYKWLREKEPSVPEDFHRVISFKSHKTKAGKRMAYIVLQDENGALSHVLAFPQQFISAYSKCAEGALVRLALRETDDGTQFINEILEVKQK